MPHATKRKRNRLSDDEKVDSALAAAEGVHAVAALLLAAVGPAAASADPIANQIASCLEYSVERLRTCASAVEAACSNTSAKKSADRAHRKLGAEGRRQRKGKQMLVRGVADVDGGDGGDVLRYALEDARATFSRLHQQTPLQRVQPVQPVATLRGSGDAQVANSKEKDKSTTEQAVHPVKPTQPVQPVQPVAISRGSGDAQIEKSKEKDKKTTELEMIERQIILHANGEAEAKLHTLAGRERDSSRCEFVDCPPSLQHLQQLKGKLLRPFVQARLCSGTKDKVTSTVGKLSGVQGIIDKLSSDPGYPITPKEDSLLLKAYLNRSVTDLTLKVEEVCNDDEADGGTQPVQPVMISRKSDDAEIPPADVNLPPPLDGNQIYSLNQAMEIISNSSNSRQAVIHEMIRRKLVPVKRAMMFRHVKKYVGDGKPEAPMHWPGGGGGQEIMPIADLKKQFLLHRSRRTAGQWSRKDTAEALLDAKRAECARNGSDASCVKPPAAETISAYHSALMSTCRREASSKSL